MLNLRHMGFPEFLAMFLVLLLVLGKSILSRRK